MQGTVLAPLKCSLSIDRIGKEALEDFHKDLYQYRGCVTIPPLGMVDDILTVTECSVKSVKMNNFVGSKIKCMQLELGENKCAQLHIGSKKTSCYDLRINNTKMNKSDKEKYLGEILTSDGKIAENIANKHGKGIGTANTILSLLKEVHFGQYYFEMALLFRNSMLINSMLCSVEALYGLKDVHVDKLENVDKYLLKKVLNASSTTAVEALYLETGAMPLRFTIISRRLMFYWTILNKSNKELVKKVFTIQNIAPIKNDWCMQIKSDLELCNINLSEAEISTMKKEHFKALVKEKIREQARLYLVSLKDSHTKSKHLDETFTLQPYLKNNSLTIDEKHLLFKYRTYTYNCKANYKWNYPDTKCSFCNSDDTQEHQLVCSIASDLNLSSTSIKYEQIFGTLAEQQQIVKVLTLIDQKRYTTNQISSFTGSQAHQSGASCT